MKWKKKNEMGNTVSSPSGQQQSPIYDRRTFPRTEREKKLLPKCDTIGRSGDNRNQNGGNQESSRMLFLMYLINRTWNVVGGKRWVECAWKCKHAIFAPKLKMKTEKSVRRCLQSDIIHFTFITTLTCFMFSRLFLFRFTVKFFFFHSSFWNFWIFQRWRHQQDAISGRRNQRR